jgi:hypothetical protein
MIVKIIGRAKLYLWDRDSLKLEIIEASMVDVRFVNGKPVYSLKSNDRNCIIVQAIHEKKASAKLLTIIVNEQKSRRTDCGSDH